VRLLVARETLGTPVLVVRVRSMFLAVVVDGSMDFGKGVAVNSVGTSDAQFTILEIRLMPM
jgi:hypothetical protein